MKILMINVVCGIRSTGRICTDLADALSEQGHIVKIAYGREEVPKNKQKYAHMIGSDLDVKLHVLRSRLFDESGFGSKKTTMRFINWVKEFDPDVIHLHNIHGYYLNIKILFDYLRTCDKKIIWTLHDCWAFTGHAAFCEGAKCEKWIRSCNNCPKLNEYPMSLFDQSERNWNIKKELFDSIPKLTIVTPSEWLAGLVKKSFLAQYPVKVVYNGIDTDLFRKIDSTKKREELGINNKRVILGVASVWDKRKGLNDFIKLRKLLNDDYIIVLVGLSQRQIEELPNGIIGISRTNSINELTELYNLAEIFVNPTYEDNYPSTNLEAISCGTPVITYDTGGSGESAKKFGEIVTQGNVKKIAEIIIENELQKKHLQNKSWLEKKEMLANYISIISGDDF